MYTCLDRNDDPMPTLFLVPLLSKWYFYLVPKLAVLLSIPQLWECPTPDKGLALAFFNCLFPPKCSRSQNHLDLLQTYEISIRMDTL